MVIGKPMTPVFYMMRDGIACVYNSLTTCARMLYELMGIFS